ncbi:C2H2 finger domain transcription factor crzA isoform X2 [Denticeps clupeoides]|uniref:C2H2-type domain-containing protein n=1 Tax=Denticeps clupeoides TaxID=299321 RepID=A0AAY4A8M8_9TELE|nr:C2H2 finger domain transcription factor crzA-like isoform X2 [Denticeps clupeoides]
MEREWQPETFASKEVEKVCSDISVGAPSPVSKMGLKVEEEAGHWSDVIDKSYVIDPIGTRCNISDSTLLIPKTDLKTVISGNHENTAKGIDVWEDSLKDLPKIVPGLTAQNQTNMVQKSLSDSKLFNVSLAMRVKDEEEKMALVFDRTITTSGHELHKNMNVSGGLCTERMFGQTYQYEMTWESAGQAMVGDAVEALDLSLPKKRRDKERKCERTALEDTGYESSLLMEVDEIEDERNEQEVEEEDCLSGSKAFRQQQPFLSAIHSPLSDTSPEDVLLIDDQGIPYTLTADGVKVPQVSSEGPAEEPGLTLDYVKEDRRSPESLPVGPESDQSSLPNPDILSSGPVPVSETPDTVSNPGPGPDLSLLPALPGLPSQSIQIVASGTSNILLLPSAQLQSSSSTGGVNGGLVSLSLPLALAQNSQPPPVVLVLSPAQTVIDSMPAALPSTSNLPRAGSPAVSPNSPLAGLNAVSEPECCQAIGPSSAAASVSPSPPPAAVPETSAGPLKHLKTNVSSDSWTPKSFREALLRASPPTEEKDESQSPIPLTSSSPKPSRSPSSPTRTSNLSTPKEMSPNRDRDEDQIPISEDASDSDPTKYDHFLPSSSPTPPLSPPTNLIFPTNHPKNLSLSSPASCPRRILYCRYCPRAFYYLSDLERHSITHSQSKPHVCQLCGKAFKRSSHLERHKHIHTGQRNFVCAICNKRFREAGELRRHQRVHTGEKPFQCPLCHMRFAELNTLRRHTKRKHQGRRPGEAEADGGDPSAAQEQQESAEWYSSAMAELDSDSEVD